MNYMKTGPKKIEIRRWLLIVLLFFAFLGVIVLIVNVPRSVRFFNASKSHYVTYFGGQTIVQTPISSNIFNSDFVKSVVTSYADIYNDTVRALIGGNLPLPEDFRWVIQCKYSPVTKELKAALYNDYWFVCQICDSSQLYRVNTVYDTLIGSLKFNSLFFAGNISARKYATFTDH